MKNSHITGIAIIGLSLSQSAVGQREAAETQIEQTEVTARSCQVQIGEFESACDSQVNLLDNEQISVLLVTVKSTPEEHEITFYTEHVGMLVIGVDDSMMVTSGRCRNNARSLRCSSVDGTVSLEIRW